MIDSLWRGKEHLRYSAHLYWAIFNIESYFFISSVFRSNVNFQVHLQSCRSLSRDITRLRATNSDGVLRKRFRGGLDAMSRLQKMAPVCLVDVEPSNEMSRHSTSDFLLYNILEDVQAFNHSVFAS